MTNNSCRNGAHPERDAKNSDECHFCPFSGCEQCPHPGGHDPNGDTPPLWEEP